MNFPLGLRTLALLAFVAASTVMIVRPELATGAGAAHPPIANTLLVVGAACQPSQKQLETDHGQA
jgi:hypothetical protein